MEIGRRHSGVRDKGAGEGMRETSTAPLIGWSRAFPGTAAQVREAASSWPGYWTATQLRTTPSFASLSWLRTPASTADPVNRAAISASVPKCTVVACGWKSPTKAAPGNGLRRKTSRMGAACWSSPSWPATSGAPGTTRRGGRSGSSAGDHRPGHRRPAARRGNRRPGPAADLHSRRPATAPAAPAARPVAGRTGRAGRGKPDYRRPAGTAGRAPCRGRTLGRLARALGEHPATTTLRAGESRAASAVP